MRLVRLPSGPLSRLLGTIAIALAIVGMASPAIADRATRGAAAAKLAALVPADDARRAVVLGPSGEVYEPDGKGAWVHRLPSWTADPVVTAGRAGPTIVACGDGVVYRLAGNGWSAIRLAQHGKAIISPGRRSLAAVGRQLFALDPLSRGEPAKLALAPSPIIAIGAGTKAAVVATETGVLKLVGHALVALPGAPRHPRLISDRWAIVDRGAFDLATAKLTAWPGGLAIGAAATTTDDALVAIGATRAGLELVTLRAGALVREPLGASGTAVGVVVDRTGRAVVALADGRIALRTPAGWTLTEVTDEAPAAHPGAGPAASP